VSSGGEMKAKITEWELQTDDRTGVRKIIFSLALKRKIKKVSIHLDGMGIRLFLKWCGARNWKSMKAFNPDKLIGKFVELPTKPLGLRKGG
jgi:hypothetical protein